MSDYIHQCPSSTVNAVTPDAVAQEFRHMSIHVDRPDHSALDNQVPDSSVSDCETVVSIDQYATPPSPFLSIGLTELEEGDKVYLHIKERFVSRLAALGAHVTVAAIHQNSHASFIAKARAHVFQAYSLAVQKKGGCDTANVRYAWYATSKEEVSKILCYGFGHSGKPENNGIYGCGVYFAPVNHPLESVMTSPLDIDGLQHLLLCRVILGKSELVSRGSKQSHPSSEQYDSGVDDLSSPRRYIIWSTHVNTHVLPEYLVSYRAAYVYRARGSMKIPKKSRKPNSPWIQFRFFMIELSKIFPQSNISLTSMYYKAHKGGKISKHVLVQQVRQSASERLLIRTMKSFRAK